jgi:hypothetical protein
MLTTACGGSGSDERRRLALPRVVRTSRLYEATAKNLLRVTIELVGGVPAQAPTADEHEPVAKEGFGAYARRVSRPYADAVARHFSAGEPTLTERGLGRLRPPGRNR